MKLSKKAIAVLENLATINPGIILKPGPVQMHTSTDRQTLVKVSIPDEFPVEMAIYDLTELLKSISFLGEPEVTINANHLVMKSDRSSIRYYFANQSVIVSPNREITLPAPIFSFTLVADDYAAILKAAGILNGKIVKIKPGVITVTHSGHEDTENEMAIEVDTPANIKTISVNVDRLKMLAGLDYVVDYLEVGAAGLIRFKNESFGIEYIMTTNV